MLCLPIPGPSNASPFTSIVATDIPQTLPLSPTTLHQRESLFGLAAHISPFQTLGTDFPTNGVTDSIFDAVSMDELPGNAARFGQKRDHIILDEASSVAPITENLLQQNQNLMSPRYLSVLDQQSWDWLHDDSIQFAELNTLDMASFSFNNDLAQTSYTTQNVLPNELGDSSTTTTCWLERAAPRDDTKSPTKANPFTNSLFVYQFKSGLAVQIVHIIDFLRNQAALKQVTRASPATGIVHPPFPRVVEVIRDSIAATVHCMLSRHIEIPISRQIPHQFLPLDTIESVFTAYVKRCAPLYPIFHPNSFMESSWDPSEGYANVGLFLTSIMTFGCLVIPVKEARSFSVELGYSILRTINERSISDEIHLVDKWVMSSWIVMMVYSAWSGAQRQLELAEAFRGPLSTVSLELLCTIIC